MMMYILFGFILLYCLLCIFIAQKQSHFILVPGRNVGLTTNPSDIGLSYEDVSLDLPDSQVPISGWYVKAARQNTLVFLFFHGNKCSIADSLEYAMCFNSLGCDTLLIDYRGYGFSKSQSFIPCETSVYEDASAALEYLINERGIEPSRIVLYGHSLGSGIAIETAKRFPDIAALIVEGAFTSILDMSALKRRFMLFPVKWLLKEKFDNLGKVPFLKVPILLLHASEDNTVPLWMHNALYSEVYGEKDRIVFEGASHTNLVWYLESLYLEGIRDFISKYVSVSLIKD